MNTSTNVKKKEREETEQRDIALTIIDVHFQRFYRSIYANRVHTPAKKEDKQLERRFRQEKELTVPSDALAPTRVPRLFQHTSKIPPEPR